MRLLLLLVMLVAPIAVSKAGEKVYRLGELEPSSQSAEFTHRWTMPELAKLGFSEGSNLVIDERVGNAATLAEMAKQLVALKPDVILAVGPEALLAARQATSTVPIVIFGPDPVSFGLAASLAHPGSNITGVVILAAELDGKRVEKLHETVPSAQRVAALLVPPSPGSERKMLAAALNAGVELRVYEVTGPDEYAASFAKMRADGAQVLAITGNPMLYRDGERLAKLALDAGLPTACEWAEMARSGCLFGYGPDRAELRRRVAYYIARIFHGSATGDLPLEQPSHYEFAINLKIAKALGLTIPQSILAGADEAIE
ncbi:MAG: ABC transporter substrate-binding protein [Hyphomicrobiales bacterium]|nr:ABC transporter substrate-binding protein [Hyphomicrobiales bacterium]MBV9520969.1 ABC transporter substrate-binding protein [Hyphomicrobiales bacterium]